MSKLVPCFLAAALCAALTPSSADITFGSRQVISDELDSAYAAHVRLADIDQDGDLDLFGPVEGETSSVLGWYENIDGLGSFSNPTLIADEFLPSWQRPDVGDIDGDGDIDLLVIEGVAFEDDTYVWFENQDGRFTERQRLLPGTGFAAASRLADLDGDGDLDIVGHDFRWYENLDGLGTYSLAKDLDTGFPTPDAMQVAGVADLEGDGDIDIFAAGGICNNGCPDKDAVWLLNDGLASFTAVATIDIDNTGWADFADFDGDGDLDVTTLSADGCSTCQGEPGGAVYLFENLDGFGRLDEVDKLGQNNDGSYLLLRDMDGDGDEDIVYSADDNLLPASLVTLENLGGGRTWADGRAIANDAWEWATYFDIGDLDGDGDLDVVSIADKTRFGGGAILAWHPQIDLATAPVLAEVGGFCPEEVELSGMQLSPFGEVSALAASGPGLSVVPDGQPCAGTPLDLAEPELLLIDTADPIGEFAATQAITEGRCGGVVQLLDHETCRVSELAEVPLANARLILDGVCPGPTGLLASDVTPGGAVSIATALNEGRATVPSGGCIGTDLALENPQFGGTITADALGRASAARELTAEACAFRVQALDEASCRVTNVATMPIAFAPKVTVESDDLTIWSLYSGDVDGDGDEDLAALVYETAGERTMGTYLNDGQGTFGPLQAAIPAGPYTLHDLADLDGDGDLDLLVRDDTGSPELTLLRNDGAGQFSAPETIEETASTLDGAIAVDIDDDGIVDIVREEAYDLVIQRGLGGGLFDPSQLLATLEEPIDVVLVGDLNGDSLPELVALWETGFNAQISIWTNLGGFAFELGGQLGFVEFRSEPTDGELADLDGDGDLDLVMSSSPSVFWLENLGSGTFGEPQVLTDNATVEAVDIDGDGDLDLVTVENRSLVEWLANLGGGRFGPPLLIASPGQLTDHSVSIDVDDDGRPEIAWGKNSGETIEYVPNLVP